MKKIIALLLMTLLLAPACQAAPGVSVVATNFPCYDFVRAVAGELAEVHMLLPPGAESHSYEPTPSDVILLSGCDLFVYVGGESDAWVESVLQSMDMSRMRVVALMDCVEAAQEQTVPGMQLGIGGDEAEYDEHVWTSPMNVMEIAGRIADELCAADPANAGAYRANCAAYVRQLEVLDAEFHNVVDRAARKTLVFGDRFPFRYLADAYGLDYFAAFPGCATQTEPSAKTVALLIDKVRAEAIPVVFHIELSGERMADTICEATGARKRLLNACHNISKGDFAAGQTYMTLMLRNVDVLKEALW